jgi:surfactin synthase thioesterase subunit
MLVNWDGKEFYAFKCMRNETNIQVVQGGHFYLTEETGKGI